MKVPTLSPAPQPLPPLLTSSRTDLSTPRSKKRQVSAPLDSSNGRMAESEPDVCMPAIPVATTENVERDIGPFLSKHIPQQYAPQGSSGQEQGLQGEDEKGNTKYCYRHRPDIKCRRQADELTMEQLQKGMEILPAADQQAISHVWSLFSAAPATHRKLMLQGILAQCCFPQLSLISASLNNLIRIDFLAALPAEISLKILCYLDTPSLCKAAQVSRRWKILADDDVVWHKMCEQHIDRKCDKCGWGLPLLERKRLKATKHQMELGAQEASAIFTNEIATGTSQLNIHGKRTDTSGDAEATLGSPPKRLCQRLGPDGKPARSRTRSWKDVYSERYKVESNWRRGRCTKKVFRGHSDGIMCLQFDDNMLATGSYDCTIKIWDIETGKEIRTLSGHGMGVRSLKFDDQKLISGSLDHTLKIWNWRTGECISTLRGHAKEVVCLDFNENLLASGSADTTVKIWNFADRNCFALKGHREWVNSVRLDSDSRTVFSASDDYTVRLWDLDTKTCIRVFEGHVGQVQQVIPIHPSAREELPPKTQILASRQHPKHPLEEYRDAKVQYLAGRPRAPPPTRIITAALDSQVRFWDVATGKCTKTLFGHVEGVWSLDADSLRVISGAQDRTVKVWDIRTGRCQRTITGHSGPVTCVGLSDSKMVTGSEDGEARLYCFSSEGNSVSGWTTPPELLDGNESDAIGGQGEDGDGNAG